MRSSQLNQAIYRVYHIDRSIGSFQRDSLNLQKRHLLINCCYNSDITGDRYLIGYEHFKWVSAIESTGCGYKPRIFFMKKTIGVDEFKYGKRQQ